MKNTFSRNCSLWLTSIAYLLALAAAIAVYRSLGGVHPLLAMFLADVAATLVVWLAGVCFKNSSVYDPYWSVAPLAIAFIWAMEHGVISLSGGLFLAVLLVWGIRLTANWARRWRGLGHQDWRYTMYQQKMPGLWPVVNLFGIHLMPTVLVYLAMVPMGIGLAAGAPANLLTFAGFLVSAAAVWLEHAADWQMDAYQKRPGPKPACIAEGVWLLCRHPNYLGEILVWWGIWLMQASLAPVFWTVIGPVAITALFVFISIPMMERHVLEARPEYARVMREVPMLLPSAKTLRQAGAAEPGNH